MSGLDDLQADLDQLAADLNNIAHGDFDEACPFCDIADRLSNLLTDRDLGVPPLTSEIIAHKEAGGKVKVCNLGQWASSGRIVEEWQDQLNRHGDLRQHAYRLVYPVPPQTERVRLDQLPGRTLPGETTPVHHFKWVYGDQRFECRRSVLDEWVPLDVATDGTVEVLKDGSK